MSTAKKIFICYSHEDEQFKQDLVKHLTWLEQIGIVQEIWSDGKIQPGEPWEKTIQDNLGKCDIAILVVSIDFLTSDFIQGEEFPRLRERRQTDGIHIVPIIARSCPWHDQELLRDLQALPGGDRTLADLSRDAAELDKAYTLITQQLRAIIEESTVQTHSVRIAQARELIARANNELQRDLARSAVTAREALKLLLQDFESSKDKRYIAALRQAISIYQMAMFRQH